MFGYRPRRSEAASPAQVTLNSYVQWCDVHALVIIPLINRALMLPMRCGWDGMKASDLGLSACKTVVHAEVLNFLEVVALPSRALILRTTSGVDHDLLVRAV